MSAQAQMRALLDQLMGTARDGSVYLCLPTSICKGVAESLMFIEPRRNQAAGQVHRRSSVQESPPGLLSS
uniref:LUC7 like n=1 Tax=Ornithorhynchus anatinus TaxID=9258 RepID=A0A6I8NUI0_ORNAN